MPFSELSVEENKAAVESSAIEAAKTFDEMKEVSAVDAAISLGIRFDMSDPLDAQPVKKSKIKSTLDIIAGIDDGSSSISEIFSTMAASEELAEDPESIQDIWEMILGTYTWDPVMEKWDYTANADAIVFNFPATDEGTTNNAALTISNYAGVNIVNPLDEDYTGDLPASLNMKLEIDGVEVITYTFAAIYNEDGIPSNIATSLTIEAFTFTVDITNNDTEASVSYKFTHNDELVMEVTAGIDGDFTQENIDNNTHTVTDTYEDYVWDDASQSWVWGTVTEEWEEVDAEEIIQSGHFRFQLFNIAINGTGDIKALVDSIKIIQPEGYREDPNYNEKTAMEDLAVLINNNIVIYAVDLEAKTRIAEVEAYVYEDSWGGGTDYWIDFRLKFGDGSLVDLETYFEEGFEDLIKEINAMISDLNTEYDLDIDPIEY